MLLLRRERPFGERLPNATAIPKPKSYEIHVPVEPIAPRAPVVRRNAQTYGGTVHPECAAVRATERIRRHDARRQERSQSRSPAPSGFSVGSYCSVAPYTTQPPLWPKNSLNNGPLYLTISTIDRRLRRHLKFPVQVSDGKTDALATVMLDSGASGTFINSRYVSRHGLQTRDLVIPILLRNADNSPNAIGRITKEVVLNVEMKGHLEQLTMAVADIGDDDIIMGIDWLRHHNPTIDWTNDVVNLNRCPPQCDNQQRLVPLPRLAIAEEVETPWGPDRTQAEWEAVPPGFRYSEKYWDQYHDAESYFVTTDDHFAYKIAASYTHSQAIAEKSAVKEGEKTFEELVPPEFREFADVFSKVESKRLPLRKPYDHAIDLEPGKVPPYSKIYPLAPAERDALREFVDENLRKGYIRPSKSPAAAPVFFIKKKDGTLRMVVDYRRLNDITVKNRYPLPLTMELVDALQKAKVFTTLDLRWGYHNVRLKQGDEWKAAFRTQAGHFEPTVMTFGLTNAPATFQHMMNDIFKDLIGVYVIIYLDDLLIFSEDESQHDEHVREVLKRLRENDLFCKPEKCKFKQTSVEYLGMIISQGKVAMDPAKVQAVLDWPTPKKVKDIQAFLGFANFYRRFIRDFSHIVKPLTTLLKKDVRWAWTENQQFAFDYLKRMFTTAPVLMMPDMSQQFIVECDASDFATGAVLSQEGDDGLIHPVAFFSKSLNDAERNYEIYDKELLAIIRALDEWRHYLEGASHKLDIVSDHKNLLYFSESRTLTRRQARWSLFLTRFDFTIRHRPGRLGGKPDAMSRRVDLQPEGEDNTGRTLLTPEMFRLKAIRRGMTQVHGDQALLRRIRKSDQYEDELVDAIELVKSKAPRVLTKELEDWSTEEGLILYQGKVYVPKDETIRRDVVKTYHDSLPAGHPGRWKTFEMVSRNYWWPGMSNFVERYVSGCDTCARTKNRSQRPVGLLQPNEIPQGPWQAISCDFITQLPRSEDYDAIFVVVDRLSRRDISLFPFGAHPGDFPESRQDILPSGNIPGHSLWDLSLSGFIPGSYLMDFPKVSHPLVFPHVPHLFSSFLLHYSDFPMFYTCPVTPLLFLSISCLSSTCVRPHCLPHCPHPRFSHASGIPVSLSFLYINP